MSSVEDQDPISTHASSIIPLPATTPAQRHGSANAPSDSHALAAADQDVKGAAQIPHDETEVKDLGWNDPTHAIPRPLVGGLTNDELWTLIRRFNKHTYHVKAMPHAPPGGLDLNIADEDEFSPEKFRSTMERFYMTVIVGMIAAFKHIARLRSWNEQKRTGAFCAVYFIAWLLDFVVPVMIAFIMALIAFPKSRRYLFPPTPLALVDTATGQLQQPPAGVLASRGSLTGAPEKHEGEAVEKEASNFVAGIAAIGISSATGQHPENPKQDEEGTLDTKVPDPSSVAMKATDAKDKAAGGTGRKHDKAKEPMQDAMWAKMRPLMHGVENVADTWERFGNALSPTPPFPQRAPRTRLAGLLVPLLLGSLFVTSYMVLKAIGLGFGFGFFGQPLIDRGVELLNTKFPHWQKLLELRNTILKGIPTNAQLAITLLRIGEANKAPIPPPPRSSSPPSSGAVTPNSEYDHAELSEGLDASPEELEQAIRPSTPPHVNDPAKPPRKKTGSKVLSFFKHTTKTGVATALGTDRIKAQVGSEHAKQRIGILPDEKDIPPQGPVDFPARMHGKKGSIFITTTAVTPCVSFAFESKKDTVKTIVSSEDSSNLQNSEALEGPNLKPVWSVAINEIKESNPRMPRKRVLVVGAGAAGMSCAHHLSNHPSDFEVTVVDPEPYCGGQAFSIPIDETRHGASWLNQGVQGGSHIFRHTFAMFRQQGYDAKPVNLQVAFGKGDTFWTNVFPTKFHEKHAGEIKKFRRVLKLVGWLPGLFVFVPIWLLMKAFRFSKDFANYMVLPTLALFLGTGNATPHVNSVILQKLFNSPTAGMWYDSDADGKKSGVLVGNNPAMVVFPNLSEFYDTWKKSLLARGVDVRLNTKLLTIMERSHAGVKVCLRERTFENRFERSIEAYDEIVFACAADKAKQLLGEQATWWERKVLGGTTWSDDCTVTHWDAGYMEKYYTNHFSEDQVALNPNRDDSARIAQGQEFAPMYYIRSYDEEPDKIEMIIYAFNCSAYQYQFPKRPNAANPALQVPLTGLRYQQVFQTIFLNVARDWRLWPKRDEISRSKQIRVDWWHQLCHTWRHYVFVVPWLWLLNNQSSKHTRFCGSWTLVNAHEVAVISGIAAAWSLGAEYPVELERDGQGGPWEGFALLCFRMYLLLTHGRWYRARGGVKSYPLF
ncbi:hypothetical protein Dda_1634 [Drechslerella dactyloides]|uniref:FAD/NAD(P)-binding domain-containing protein n=1 Tax=Drechslerella dactyloides TaxID=74499 RepID=A0AAD6J2D2_DREDA|nr:hypothetical protein Dda_1634 [Drechslerella dactyloides]